MTRFRLAPVDGLKLAQGAIYKRAVAVEKAAAALQKEAQELYALAESINPDGTYADLDLLKMKEEAK